MVRWLHPVRGLISPTQFIPIAEESGLIAPLGEWVLRQAFGQLKSWREQGIPPLRIAVNISALQFRKRGFPEFLKVRLAEYEVDPRLVELELTERRNETGSIADNLISSCRESTKHTPGPEQPHGRVYVTASADTATTAPIAAPASTSLG